MKRQLAFLLARAQVPLEWIQPDGLDELPSDLVACLSNTELSSHFRQYGKELGVHEAKSLEDIYKSHLENVRKFSSHHPSQLMYNAHGSRHGYKCGLCKSQFSWDFR